MLSRCRCLGPLHLFRRCLVLSRGCIVVAQTPATFSAYRRKKLAQMIKRCTAQELPDSGLPTTGELEPHVLVAKSVMAAIEKKPSLHTRMLLT